MNVTQLFGIPLYSKQLQVNNDLLHSYEDWNPINNGQRTKTNKYLNDNPYYSDLMAQCVNEYMYEVLLIKRHIGWRWTTSWGLRHDPGHFSKVHIHANAMFSCILYTEVPEESGDLIISKDQRPTWTTGTVLPDVERLTNLTAPEVHIKASNGYCIIFPGFVHHGSGVNKSNDSRYCIVGNVFVKGTMGDDDDHHGSPLSELVI
tara:strand:+ start:190 stop:801 length:612 start_codon:yes stop_codon:yes gene_type:complete